ncbi:hypothetical protein EDB81DRAFT_773584 [Dactylonectria macrodidyma]|uniref:Uncharacterized protein n=1 Tax=Dactylonectria macrodidyma TaxID=307937 RepID=A0A9P9FT09_9HYPO|nr:hypothetical protein EDB81DRAFT_773584 [Dactylonectria macrodidyma]
MCSPLASACFFWGYDHWSRCWRDRNIALGKVYPYIAFVVMSTLALVLARLFLIVESFRSLYYLLPEAYMATWAANILHIR